MELFVLARINPLDKSGAKRVFDRHQLDVPVVRKALQSKKKDLDSLLKALEDRNLVRRLGKASLQCSVRADNTRHALIPYISDFTTQIGKGAKRTTVNFFADLKKWIGQRCEAQKKLALSQAAP